MLGIIVDPGTKGILASVVSRSNLKHPILGALVAQLHVSIQIVPGIFLCMPKAIGGIPSFQSIPCPVPPCASHAITNICHKTQPLSHHYHTNSELLDMNTPMNAQGGPSFTDLRGVEDKLADSIIRFARNPIDQRIENGVKSQLVSYITHIFMMHDWMTKTPLEDKVP